MLDRIKAWCGRPSEEYIARTICELMKKAEKKQGTVITAHFGLRNSASVIFPKEQK